MRDNDIRTHALEQAVAALLGNDASALKDICQRVNKTQFNLCLVPTALSASLECLKTVVGPLKDLYNSSEDCLNLLAQKEPDEERLKILIPYSNPATVHQLSGKTLWGISLFLNMPASFYQNWDPNSETVAESLPNMGECRDSDLLVWCVKKAADLKSTDWAKACWKAAQDKKNYELLNTVANHVDLPHHWGDEIKKNWGIWEDTVDHLTVYPRLAALVVSVAVEKNNWKVVHNLLPHAEKSATVTDACVASHNIFVCYWAFSHGCVLSASHLWELISHPESRPLTQQRLTFFQDLLEADKKWNMGVWENLIKECGPTELFCQLLMHGEEASDILRPQMDPMFATSLPLRLAAVLGREKTLSAVLPHSNARAYNSQALALAAINGHTHIVKQLLPHSDPSADTYRALACALWFDSQHKKSTCAWALITSETSPEQTIELWKKQIKWHSLSAPYGDVMPFLLDKDAYEVDDLGKDLSDETLIDFDIFSKRKRDKTHKKITINQMSKASQKQVYTMSWLNFDEPIKNWWESMERSHFIKIGQHLSNVFPEALKQYLCAANEKNPVSQKRKI